jgi:hypothetical protein
LANNNNNNNNNNNIDKKNNNKICDSHVKLILIETETESKSGRKILKEIR